MNYYDIIVSPMGTFEFDGVMDKPEDFKTKEDWNTYAYSDYDLNKYYTVNVFRNRWI